LKIDSYLSFKEGIFNFVMGVRGLLTYCKGIVKHADMSTKGFRIGIDVYSLFFLFREKRDEFKTYLENLSELHTLECIIDTRAQKEKEEVVKERKELRKEAYANVKEIHSFQESDVYQGLDEQQRKVLDSHVSMKKRDAWCVYKEYTKWFCNLLESLNIPFIRAEEEADTVLAKGNYDVVITSDSDLLIYGVKRLWIPRGSSWGLQHNEIDGNDFIQFIKLTREQIYQLAFLAGCDIQPRKIFPIDEAVNLLRFYGSIEVIHKKMNKKLTKEDVELYATFRKAWFTL
jgi:5'-3' exonuclease